MKMTFAELAEEAGLPVPEARKALKKLEGDGLVRSMPSDAALPVELTDEGKRIARLFGFNV
jgi:DNA-binding MarR family transcriptional regulator